MVRRGAVLKYGSVCSGIEAASVAWHPLGWKASFFSEIEPFPRAVLAHHYPNVPLHGDFTTIGADDYESINLLVGGTPCQSFSIAGLRGGLADDRGNLALEFLKLADRTRPRWLVWENVPGVLSSNGGRDFGSIVGGMVKLGYGISYRTLDAQYFGVPQRRRRVFVVGYLGDWRRAAAVLFERESLRGDSPPCREAGERVAPTISARTKGGGGLGTDFDLDGGLISSTGDVAHCLNAGGMGRLDYETETMVVAPAQIYQDSEYGAKAYDTAGTLRAGREPHHQVVVAFTCKDHGADASSISPTLRSMGHSLSHANAGGQVAVAFAYDMRGREGGAQFEGPHDTANIRASNGGSSRSYVAAGTVRRLTPLECERLQGFPDGYTNVPYRGKQAADGPRYKAIGNSMAVPVMRWIGERIEAVERLS